jgi:WD40 repeat protein
MIINVFIKYQDGMLWSNEKELVTNIEGDHQFIINQIIELENGDLVSGSSNGDIQVWNVENGELIKTIHHVYPRNRYFNMVSLADGNVACSGFEGLIHIWNLEKEEIVKVLYGHTRKVDLLLISNNNLASYESLKGILNKWNVKSGHVVKQLERNKLAGFIALPNDRLAAIVQDLTKTSGKEILIWNSSTDEIVEIKVPIEREGKGVSEILFLNENLLASSQYTKILIWNFISGQLMRTFENITSIKWLSLFKGESLATFSYDYGSKNNEILFWNWKTDGHLVKTVEIEENLKDMWSFIELKKSDNLAICHLKYDPSKFKLLKIAF